LQRVRFALAFLVLGAVGAAAPFAIPAIGAGSSKSSVSKTITIRVTASEFKFALSRRSVPTGTTVIFKVTNKGKIQHDFKIAGKKTVLLSPGKSASVKVKFSKKGRFGYLCTVKGHAAIGMKGTFSVGVKAVTTTITTTSTTSTTTTTTTTTTGTTTTQPPQTCTPATTTVTVAMSEYKFTLDKNTVPAGCIQFVITNLASSQVQHNFDIVGVKAGTIMSPGGTETWAVQLGAGTKNYTCDVPFHESFGMVGSLTVT
jgi:uncharacterized cupredoxin-like copper-binding protein